MSGRSSSVASPDTVRWRSHGLVFAPSGRLTWLRSHASLPVVLGTEGDLARVLFAGRDAANRSHVGALTLDLTGEIVSDVDAEPLLAPGPTGTFDADGVYAASVAEDEGRTLLYTIGWLRGVPDPLFHASIGLAVSEDGGRTFTKLGAPVMGRSEHDPCLVTSPFVLRDGDAWRMWYVSGFAWTWDNGRLRSHYDIKYAESEDGLRWRRDGLVCIDLREGETNVSRPCVLKDGDRYRMWYACDRGSGYRIGYAESGDGYTWERLDDQVGIAPPASGWDSEAQCYPWVFSHRSRLLMLYNGNGFGRDGFGLAEAT